MKMRSFVGLSAHPAFHWWSAQCAARMLLLLSVSGIIPDLKRGLISFYCLQNSVSSCELSARRHIWVVLLCHTFAVWVHRATDVPQGQYCAYPTLTLADKMIMNQLFQVLLLLKARNRLLDLESDLRCAIKTWQITSIIAQKSHWICCINLGFSMFFCVETFYLLNTIFSFESVRTILQMVQFNLVVGNEDSVSTESG